MGETILYGESEFSKMFAKAVLTRLENIDRTTLTSCLSDYYLANNLQAPCDYGQMDEKSKFLEQKLGYDIYGNEKSQLIINRVSNNKEEYKFDKLDEVLQNANEERETCFINGILDRVSQLSAEAIVQPDDKKFFESMIPMLEQTAQQRNEIAENLQSQNNQIIEDKIAEE